MKELPSAYRTLLHQADEWFARAARAHAPDVQCRAGCDLCCRGLFDITPLDALLVAEGARRADPATAAALLRAATRTLARIRRAAPRWGPPFRVGDLGIDDFDQLCDALADEPCPALAAGGTCRLYADRPLVCRLHGLPMYDPDTGTYVGGECELNLPASGLPDKPALHFDHARFERRELDLLGEVAGAPAARSPEDAGTIIAAVVADALSPPAPVGNNRDMPEPS